jgi:radical SAM protein with 4Fe4S-binding SPASM domain
MSLDGIASVTHVVTEAALNRNDPGPLRIGLSGGEPLLNHRELDAFYRGLLSRDLGREVQLSFTTNGSHVEEDMLAILCDVDAAVTVSVDGCAAVHDAQRRTKSGAPTAGRVAQNLERLASRLPSKPMVAAVLTDRGMNKAFDEAWLASISRLGITQIAIEPAFGQAFQSTARDVAIYLWSVRDTGKKLGLSVGGSWISPLVGLKEASRGNPRLYSCLGASGETAAISPDLRVRTCPYTSAPGRSVWEWQHYKTSDRRYHALETTARTLSEYCDGCAIEGFCGGGCSAAPVDLFDERATKKSPESLRSRLFRCEIYRESIYAGLERIATTTRAKPNLKEVHLQDP